MQDGMKSNPEESLRRALAEFADETGLAMASDSVRLRLKRETSGASVPPSGAHGPWLRPRHWRLFYSA